MDTNKLIQFGLSSNEAKIYVALLELCKAQAGEISRKTQINRTTIYDSIERLIEKGLVSYVIESNAKIFLPISPKKFLQRIKEQQKVADKLFLELDSLFGVSEEREESNIYRGRKGIKTILNEILSVKKHDVFGSSGNLPDSPANFLGIMKHDFIIFQKRKKELKIKARVILNESSRNSKIITLSHSDIRYIPDEFSSTTSTFIYGNSVAIIIWSETPIATVIKSKQVKNAYLNYFELLWKAAKL